MKVFLTSAGFDNKEVLRRFVETAHSNKMGSRILFVTTAAINDGGKAMLPFCRSEILEAGISTENIDEIEIADIVSIGDMSAYCAIYVAGGDTAHLVNEMRKHNFRKLLEEYLLHGGVYFGVSAGSIALTNTFPGCLNFLDCTLGVHATSGPQTGTIDTRITRMISLTDNQAIFIDDDIVEIIG